MMSYCINIIPRFCNESHLCKLGKSLAYLIYCCALTVIDSKYGKPEYNRSTGKPKPGCKCQMDFWGLMPCSF
jgi:hypothetical protein